MMCSDLFDSPSPESSPKNCRATALLTPTTDGGDSLSEFVQNNSASFVYPPDTVLSPSAEVPLLSPSIFGFQATGDNTQLCKNLPLFSGDQDVSDESSPLPVTTDALVHIGTDVISVSLPTTVFLAMNINRANSDIAEDVSAGPFSMEEVSAASVMVQTLSEAAEATDYSIKKSQSLPPSNGLLEPPSLLGPPRLAPCIKPTTSRRSRALTTPVGNAPGFECARTSSMSGGTELERKQSTNNLPEFVKMSRDQKGSIKLQDLLEGMPKDQLSSIIQQQLAPFVTSLSVHTNGCRVIQKAIEVCSLEDCLLLASNLNSRVVEICGDSNGNHVMQKFIEILSSEHIDFIVQAIAPEHVLRLSVHCYGCRVMQRLLQKCSMTQKVPLLAAVREAGEADRRTIVADQYGNYVIQHCIQYGRPEDRSFIAKHFLLPHVTELSSNKFGSNVIEKALEFCSMEDKRGLVAVLLISSSNGSSPSNNPPPIVNLMKDRYANFVVSKILDYDEDRMPEVKMIKKLIVENVQNLRKFNYAWHMIEKLERSGKLEGGLIVNVGNGEDQYDNAFINGGGFPMGGGRRRVGGAVP